MNHDILESVSQGGNNTQDAENSRIAAIADELYRLCQLHETQSGTGQADVTPFEREQRLAEQMAKDGGYWIPMMQVFDLGVPGPSGNENDTYVSDDAIYKVNNLMNSGGIVALLHKVLMHNYLFPDTAYQFYGLYGQMSEAQRRFLGQISNMNIEARYPEYKTGIARSLNKDTCRNIINETKQMQQWILQKCSQETKPSELSETISKS